MKESTKELLSLTAMMLMFCGVFGTLAVMLVLHDHPVLALLAALPLIFVGVKYESDKLTAAQATELLNLDALHNGIFSAGVRDSLKKIAESK